MYQNLHCHTKISDGELNYKQVLDVCADNNISVVAFTDHDTLPNEKSMQLLEKNRHHKTKWIIGTEISAGWPKEIKGCRSADVETGVLRPHPSKRPSLKGQIQKGTSRQNAGSNVGSGAASNFHIVGLFVKPFNKSLIEHCQKAQAGRIERMERMVKNLKSLGFEISKEDCLKESKGETIGRPHIISALIKKEKNLKIIEQLKNKMKKEAEHNPEIKQKYEEMIKKGEYQYPYVLFLDPNAFLPDIYVDYLYFKDMDESVKIIREADGVAILAHWSFSKNIVNEKMIEKFFQEKRLDGAEIVFGVGINNQEIKNDMKIMKKLTEKYNMLQSGGGDSHTKADFELFFQEKWFAKKTIGLVEKIMKIRDLNLEFSSICGRRTPTNRK